MRSRYELNWFARVNRNLFMARAWIKLIHAGEFNLFDAGVNCIDVCRLYAQANEMLWSRTCELNWIEQAKQICEKQVWIKLICTGEFNLFDAGVNCIDVCMLYAQANYMFWSRTCELNWCEQANQICAKQVWIKLICTGESNFCLWCRCESHNLCPVGTKHFHFNLASST